MRSNGTFALRAVICLAVFLLIGCSAVRLGYNHGERLTYWWLSGYVDIDSDQRPRIKHEIAELFAWHRKTQLKDYVQLLGSVQKQLQQPVSKREVLAVNDQLIKRVTLIVDRALPQLADLALSLQPDQIEDIERKFASNNEKYRKDYLRGDLEQRQRFRFGKVMEQAEYWFGDFNAEQQALIRRASDARPLGNETWLSLRMQRQRDLLRILRKIHAEKMPREAVMLLLKEHAGTLFEPAPGNEYSQFFAASKEATADLTAFIINNTTPAQKAHAIQKLQDWIDNFEELSTAARS